MSLNRRNPKRDGNESAIIAALKAIGATVYPVSGRGVADLLVGFNGQNYLMETKTRTGKLTPAQVEFSAAWQGQYCVVRTVEDALIALGLMRGENA